MASQTTTGSEADLRPAFAAPPGACDCHFHIFGSPERYPYASDLRYDPPVAPLHDYLKIAKRLGFERFVFVQPSAYGFNNACQLDAMRDMDSLTRRGVVDLNEKTVTDMQIGLMDEIGVRGIRINVSPIHPPEAGLADSLLPRIDRMAKIAREVDWHLDFLIPGWLVVELIPTLRKLQVDFSIAHFGLFPAEDGVAQKGFGDFLSLVGDGSRRCWVKISGAYRISAAPGFADVKPLVEALLAAAPEQLIWGSDFPFLSFADRVNMIELYNLLADWIPDAKTRTTILVDNPARLFGFA
jgi:predicted TIM-barrel fold metal-dependent hydrolase